MVCVSLEVDRGRDYAKAFTCVICWHAVDRLDPESFLAHLQNHTIFELIQAGYPTHEKAKGIYDEMEREGYPIVWQWITINRLHGHTSCCGATYVVNLALDCMAYYGNTV